MIAETTTTEIRNETLGDVVSRQAVVPEWLRNLVTENGLDAPVVSMTRVTAFGNYLTSVRVTA